MTYHIVKYTGTFGFIKPWTAVRDGNTSGIATFSQQFLTPSIIEGIEKKLFPSLLKENGIHKIKRHRLTYDSISGQMEQTQPRGWNVKKVQKLAERPRSILTRGVMINPTLWLVFEHAADAEAAALQHICLCRNEDILFPDPEVIEVSRQDFDDDTQLFPGFELVFEENEESFLVGFNRYDQSTPMYGWLKIVGNPIKSYAGE